jgi:hypothetical protein
MHSGEPVGSGGGRSHSGKLATFPNGDPILDVAVHEKFVADMEIAGIVTPAYRCRFSWEGPAARSDEQNGPTLQDIIKKTAVPLQRDSLDSNYIVYPIGQASAEWKDAGADSDGEEIEPDGYNDA